MRLLSLRVRIVLIQLVYGQTICLYLLDGGMAQMVGVLSQISMRQRRQHRKRCLQACLRGYHQEEPA